MSGPGSVPPGRSTSNQMDSTDVQMFTGAVAETMDAAGYTYFLLRSEGQEIWVATTRISVTAGETLTVPLIMPMRDFRSDALQRSFPLIYFVAGLDRAAAPAMPEPTAPPVVELQPPPEGALSVAEIWASRDRLSGAQATVRGTVVKVNNAIMGRNWIHLQDGSGSAETGTNELIITTNARVQIGQVITVTGTVAANKDLGSGYVYDVLLENATIR